MFTVRVVYSHSLRVSSVPCISDHMNVRLLSTGDYMSRHMDLFLTCAVTGEVACTAGEARRPAATIPAAAAQKDVFIVVAVEWYVSRV